MTDLTTLEGWSREEGLAVRRDGAALVVTVGGHDVEVLLARPESPAPVLTAARRIRLEPDADPRERQEDWRRLALIADRVADQRSSLVICRIEGTVDAPVLAVTVTVHGDGLSKHTFMTALHEVGKVCRTFESAREQAQLALSVLADISEIAPSLDGDETARLDEVSLPPPDPRTRR